MKLALFDLDGTLFDTRDVNFYAYKRALEVYNISLDYEYYTKKCNGKHYKDFLPTIITNVDNNTYDEIHKLKKGFYTDYLDKARENVSLFQIIDSLKKSDYKVAVVTTASKKNCMEILNYFNRLDMFDLIVTPEDYEKTKPAPDSFIYAINYFKSNPENTMIFEDSDVGIEAALATNASVFKIEKF